MNYFQYSTTAFCAFTAKEPTKFQPSLHMILLYAFVIYGYGCGAEQKNVSDRKRIIVFRCL